MRKHNDAPKNCDICDEFFCTSYLLKKHRADVHKMKSESKKEFQCKVCSWTSVHKARVLLHLIHHPDQEVDESQFDVSVLKRFGIMS